jgi:hypothetical protein
LRGRKVVDVAEEIDEQSQSIVESADDGKDLWFRRQRENSSAPFRLQHNKARQTFRFAWQLKRQKREERKEKKKKSSDPTRIRTWNLLIRSQTRYPLRHWTDCSGCFESDRRQK